MEPVIQVMYEVKMKLGYKPINKDKREYFLIGPNGGLMKLSIQ